MAISILSLLIVYNKLTRGTLTGYALSVEELVIRFGGSVRKHDARRSIQKSYRGVIPPHPPLPPTLYKSPAPSNRV